jgi:3-hydroxyisobutyrate dehydrogenase-like beta-hydroxyacid dehydrogenase
VRSIWERRRHRVKQKIGMIGIGALGMPMALNLLKAGYPLTVYSTTPRPSRR